MGDDFWPYGLERNRKTLETFLRYHHEQGLSKRLLTAGRAVRARGAGILQDLKAQRCRIPTVPLKLLPTPRPTRRSGHSLADHQGGANLNHHHGEGADHDHDHDFEGPLRRRRSIALGPGQRRAAQRGHRRRLGRHPGGVFQDPPAAHFGPAVHALRRAVARDAVPVADRVDALPERHLDRRPRRSARSSKMPTKLRPAPR